MSGCTIGPIANAATTVPTPTSPPSSHPTTTTVTSMTVRASQSGQPKRSCTPTIRPSRAPVPSPAPM